LEELKMNATTTQFGSLIATGTKTVLFCGATHAGTGDKLPQPIEMSVDVLRRFVGHRLEMPSIAAGETVSREILGVALIDGVCMLTLSSDSGVVHARVHAKA
jgi:hypothetical protein